MSADEVLKGRDGNEDARTLAVLNDACDVPVVVKKIVSVADFQMLGASRPIVDQHIVGSFHVVAGEKHKAASDVAEGIAVDAVDNFHAAGGVELQQSGCQVCRRS